MYGPRAKRLVCPLRTTDQARLDLLSELAREEKGGISGMG